MTEKKGSQFRENGYVISSKAFHPRSQPSRHDVGCCLKTHGSRIQEEVFGVNIRLSTRRQRLVRNSTILKDVSAVHSAGRGSYGFCYDSKVVVRTSKIVVGSKGFCLISSKSSVSGACYFMELLLMVRVFSTARLKMKILLLALVSAAKVVLSQLLLLVSVSTASFKWQFMLLVAGVGPLSGKGPRVIVSADASILPRLSSPAIRCIGPGPIRVYYEPSPVSLVFILYVIKSPQSSLLTVCGTIIACVWLRGFFVSLYLLRDLTAWVPYPAVIIIFLPYLCTVDWEVYWHVTASLKCVLTQEHLDAICAKYFIPEEVHPQLPRSDATVHERPAGKVGMYTRFFDYANYRIPFSTFFVSVLIHFGIPFSQLSVFEPAKNLDSVKNWNDHFLWVDEFVVPANARFKMDLNAFIRTADPRKVRIVERARAENERPIVTVAKHRTVTLLPASVVRSSGELSASVEREFVGDASVGDGGDQGFDSVGGQDNIEPTVPVTEHVETETPGPKRTKKKRVIRECERTTAASQPPKRLRADYGTTRVSVTGGKSPSVLNRLLQDSRLLVEQGIPALPTLPFITSSVTASPLEEGGDHTDFATGPSLRTVGPSVRFVVLSDSAHHSGAKSADPEADSLVRSATPVMTEATTVATIATTVAIPADVGKDKSASHPSIFGSSSSSEKTDRTLSLFTGRSGSGFAAGSIRAEEAIGAGLEEIYVPEWTVTKGFELNDGHSCANMIDHFTPPAFFKTIRGIEYEQLFAEFNVSASRNLSLSSEVSGLEATEGSLRGEVASAKEYNGLLEQECGSLKLKVTSLESTIAEKDRELSDLGASSSSLKSQNQSLVNQVHELETFIHGIYEVSEIAALIHPVLYALSREFPSAPPQRRCRAKMYMEALGHAFGRAIEKGMQEGLAAGIEHGQAGRCLTDLEAYIPSAEVDFNSAVRDLRDFQLMVPVHHKQDRVVIGSQALSVALDICRGRVEKMERNLVERLPFLKDVFVSLDHPLSAEALIEPPVEVPATNVLSTMVIVPHSSPSVSVEDYENPNLVDVVPKDVTLGPEGEENIDAPTGGDLALSKLNDEARDVVL
ncbi:hypothetical protein Tco_1133665 [Tanacetum coccineum]